ncbi:MAG: hypothetical protein MHM6MM_001057 [Cercozoa sp. M6MM]
MPSPPVRLDAFAPPIRIPSTAPVEQQKKLEQVMSPTFMMRESASNMERSVVQLRVVISAPSRELFWSNEPPQEAGGSGVVVLLNEKKYILTCGHVIADAQVITLARDQDNVSVPLRLVSVFHEVDLALLERVPQSELNPNDFEVDDIAAVWDDLSSLDLYDRNKGLPVRSEQVSVIGFPMGGTSLCLTRGVVSRVEMTQTAHSGNSSLAVQVDAAINFGNSGGALIKDGKLLGIVHQGFDQLQSHGEAIAMPVVTHFLRQSMRLMSESTERPVKCRLAVLGAAQAQPLLDDPKLRRFLQVPASHTGGVWLRRVPRQLKYAMDGEVKDDDVLLCIDGLPVRGDATVAVPEMESPVSLSYLCQQKEVGDTIDVTLWRPSEKRLIETQIALEDSTRISPVRPFEYDTPSSWLLLDGMVCTRLTLPLLEALQRVSVRLASFLEDQSGVQSALRSILAKEQMPEGYELHEFQIVVVADVLQDHANRTLSNATAHVMKKFDGVRIFNLRHLKQLMENATNRASEKPELSLVRVDFTDDTSVVVDVLDAARRLPALMTQYRVPAPLSRDLMSKEESAMFEEMYKAQQRMMFGGGDSDDEEALLDSGAIVYEDVDEDADNDGGMHY